jgi:hypothetical protein
VVDTSLGICGQCALARLKQQLSQARPGASVTNVADSSPIANVTGGTVNGDVNVVTIYNNAAPPRAAEEPSRRTASSVR